MKTERIFDTDSFVIENEAKVISCNESAKEEFKGLYEVITDSSIFAPLGGGQNSDIGTFDDIRVLDVREEGDTLIHYLEKPVEEGKNILQKIDFELRFRRMQNHNAEHLICGLIHKKFGFDNVGFHLSESFDDEGKLLRIEAVMDVNGPISKEDLEEIEMDANRAISENVPIRAILPSPEEAGKYEYRSKLDIKENLRLVAIEGYDLCACCAPCLRSSAQIQLVKILDHMPHRKGMRLTLTAGLDAVGDYILLHKDNSEIMRMLSSKREDCSKAVSIMSEKLNAAHEENIFLKKEMTLLYQKFLDKKTEETKGKYVCFFADILDEVQSRNLINEAVGKYEKTIVVFFAKNDSGYRFAAGKNNKLSDVSLKELALCMKEKLNARGGGNEQMIQGSIPDIKDDIVSFFENME